MEDRPEVKAFVDAFRQKYNREPANAMGALGYDAAGVLIDAIKRATSYDSKGIRDAIASTANFAGVSGTITIGPDGNAQKAGLILTATKR
jgi:branched-chain amino acid transport system substrate-binding protein